jgi:hypothetical protein
LMQVSIPNRFENFQIEPRGCGVLRQAVADPHPPFSLNLLSAQDPSESRACAVRSANFHRFHPSCPEVAELPSDIAIKACWLCRSCEMTHRLGQIERVMKITLQKSFTLSRPCINVSPSLG